MPLKLPTKEVSALLAKVTPPIRVARVISLVYGCFLILLCGSLYGFSAYSDVLKVRMGFSARDVNLIISIALFGQTFFSFVGGYLVDSIGPCMTLVYGTALSFIGFSMVYLQFISHFSRSAALMALWYLLIGHGSNTSYMAGLNVNVRNFKPQHRTIVTGLLQMCFGLSSAFFSNLYKYFFSKSRDLDHFLVVYLVLIPLGSLIGAVLIRRCPLEPEKPSQSKAGAPRKQIQGSDADGGQVDGDEEEVAGDAEKKPLIDVTKMREEEEAKALRDSRVYGKFHKGRSGMQLLRSVRFMFLYISVTFTASATLLFLSNVKLIFKANGIDEQTTLVFVTFTSYANTVGRLIFAFASFFAMRSKVEWVRAYFCQPFFLAFAAIAACASCVLLELQGPLLYPVACILPLAYGALFGVLPTYVNFRFGDAHFGANYGLVSTGAAIFNFIFGQIAGLIYDHFAKGKPYCSGAMCYGYTFLICLVATGVSAVCMVVVYIREMKKVRRDYANERRELAAEATSTVASP